MKHLLQTRDRDGRLPPPEPSRPTPARGALTRLAQRPKEPTMTHVLHRSIAHHYPTAVSGRGVFIRDETGKDYIDASGGAAAVPECFGDLCSGCLQALKPPLFKAVRRR